MCMLGGGIGGARVNDNSAEMSVITTGLVGSDSNSNGEVFIPTSEIA